MKRYFAFFCTVLLLCVMVLPAFAETTGTVEITSSNPNGYTVFSVSVPNATASSYSLILLKGEYDFAPDNVETAQNILYFTEKSTSTPMVFDGVIPQTNDSFTAFAVGSDGTVTLLGSYTAEEVVPPDVPDTPDVPDEPDLPDIPVNPDTPDTPATPDEPVEPAPVNTTLIIGIVLGVVAVGIVIFLFIWLRRNVF